MAGKSEATDYVCTLSNDLIKQAEEELNEKPEWRSRDIQALRDMVLKKSGIHTCMFDNRTIHSHVSNIIYSYSKLTKIICFGDLLSFTHCLTYNI